MSLGEILVKINHKKIGFDIVSSTNLFSIATMKENDDSIIYPYSFLFVSNLGTIDFLLEAIWHPLFS